MPAEPAHEPGMFCLLAHFSESGAHSAHPLSRCTWSAAGRGGGGAGRGAQAPIIRKHKSFLGYNILPVFLMKIRQISINPIHLLFVNQLQNYVF